MLTSFILVDLIDSMLLTLHVHAEIYRAADVVFLCILPAYIARVIPRSLQLQAHVSANLGSCHKSGQCAKSWARRSVCYAERWRSQYSSAYVAAVIT